MPSQSLWQSMFRPPVSALHGAPGYTPAFALLTPKGDGTISTDPVKGDATASFTRTTEATLTDYEGVIRTVPSGEARIEGARRVENLLQNSNSLLGTGWAQSASFVGESVPENDSTRFTCVGTLSHYVFQTWLGTLRAGDTVVMSLEAKVDSTWTGSFGLSLYDVGTAHVTRAIPVTTTFTRHYVTITATSDLANPTIRIGGYSGHGVDGESVQIRNVQVENITGRADQLTPSEYVATTTAAASRYYSTTPSQRVDTNLCLQSQDFSSAFWTPNANAILVPDYAAAPDGTFTANRLIDNSGGGSSTVNAYTGNCDVELSAPMIISLYAKADQLDWLLVNIINTGTTVRAYFDLTNGAVGVTLGDDNTDQGIVDCGNGWYRCWIRFTASSSDSTAQLSLGVAEGDGDSAIALDGTASILVWGAQLEVVTGLASSYPSEYIATTTAAVSELQEITQFPLRPITNTLGIKRFATYAPWEASEEVSAGQRRYVEVDGLGYYAVAQANPELVTNGTFDTDSNWTTGGTWTISGGAATLAAGSSPDYITQSGVLEIGKTYTYSITVTSGNASNFPQLYTEAGAIVSFATGPGTYTGTFVAAGTSLRVRAVPPSLDVTVDNVSVKEVPTTGSTEPTWVADGTDITDGGVTWTVDDTNLYRLKGPLIEEARTNLIPSSEDFSTGWANTNTADTQAAGTAPDGTNTANKLTESIVGTSDPRIVESVDSGSAITTFSVYAKAAERTSIYMYNEDSATGRIFTLTGAGVIGPVVIGAPDSSTIESVGDGWYRCSITDTTTGICPWRLGISDGTNFSYTTDGSSGVFYWGAQLEAGSAPSSYIPTTTAPVTRNADVLTYPTSGWYNDDAGSMLSDAVYSAGDTQVFHLHHGNYDDQWQHIFTAGASVAAQFYNSLTLQASINPGPAHARGAEVRIVGCGEEDAFGLTVQGGAVATDSSGVMPSGITTLTVGRNLSSTGAHLDGTLLNLVYIPSRISDADLVTLSKREHSND